jgi:hypothetical protein
MAAFPLRICSTLPESNALSFARVSQLELTAEGEGDDSKTATPVTEYPISQRVHITWTKIRTNRHLLSRSLFSSLSSSRWVLPSCSGRRNAEDDNRHEYTKGVLPCRWPYGRNGVCRIERREIRPPFFTGQTGKFCRAS